MAVSFGSLSRLFIGLKLVFTALHVMQTLSSDENSVCLSVCHTREL